MAMSSLIPGVLFKNTGLNQTHTPTEITATPDQVKTKYKRTNLSDKPWPPESPVSRVYDVQNTSSQLIILNNRMNEKSHLRAQSGRYRTPPSSSDSDKERGIEPDRHYRSVSPCSPKRHVNCHDSSSPMYQPTPSNPPSAPSSASRSSPRAHRYLSATGPANPKEWHHYSSQVDSHPGYQPPKRSKSAGHRRGPIEPPPCFSRDKRWLQHPDMTYGQKKYMNSIACTYDITHMKQLKQAQYIQLIYREQQRAMNFFTPENYRKYLQYLNSERIMQFGVKAAPSALSTSRSPRKGKENKEKSNSGRESRNSETQAVSPKRQSAPKPPSQRTPTPTKTSSEQSRDNGKNGSQDDTEYMMYHDPEHPKKDKDQQAKTKKSPRPKSSKYRHRPASNDRQEKTKSDSPDELTAVTSDSESETRRPKSGRKEKKEKYWQQPAPPVREKEPDGTGLVMTEGTDLDKDGETLEAISSDNERSGNRQSSKPSALKKVNQESATKTYDIEDGDGAKTRVYQSTEDSEPKSKSAHDDTPVLKEDSYNQGNSIEDKSGRPQGRAELQQALDGKRVVLESSTDSKRAHKSGYDSP